MGSSGLREEPYDQGIPPPPDQITGASPKASSNLFEIMEPVSTTIFRVVLRDIHDRAFLVGIARLYHPRSDGRAGPRA